MPWSLQRPAGPDSVCSRSSANASTRLENTLWQSFVPLNSFLSIGPPVRRLQELVALMEAGVVTLLGPDMTVEIEEAYCTYSKRFDDTRYHATQLIEARIPSTAIRRTNNSLLRQLLNDRIIHPHQLAIPNEVPFETVRSPSILRPIRSLDQMTALTLPSIVLGFPQKASTG